MSWIAAVSDGPAAEVVECAEKFEGTKRPGVEKQVIGPPAYVLLFACMLVSSASVIESGPQGPEPHGTEPSDLSVPLLRPSRYCARPTTASRSRLAGHAALSIWAEALAWP